MGMSSPPTMPPKIPAVSESQVPGPHDHERRDESEDKLRQNERGPIDSALRAPD